MSDPDRSKNPGGVAPFGYRWRNGKLMVDRGEAPVRILIYELFLVHRRKKTVAKLLNDLGYRTRNASFFSDTTVNRLLRDTTAKGVRVVDGRTVEVEPIVSREVWQRVNDILDARRPPKQSIHLFTGVLYCDCGEKMIVPGDATKYVCVGCRRKILLSDLEAIFHSMIRELNDFQYDRIHAQWAVLTKKEQRIIVEQICESVVVAKDAVRFEFCFGLEAAQAESSSHGGNVDLGNPTSAGRLPVESDLADPMLSEAEAAKFLGISKMTMLRRRKAGDVGHYRVGSRVLYSKEKHLRPYLESHEEHRRSR